jgi:hypothetical protein
MILYPDSLIIPQLHDGVSSKGDGGHGMEKLGTLVTKSDSIFSVPIFPVEISSPKKSC